VQDLVTTIEFDGVYDGARFLGKPHGFGRFTFSGGEIYVGEWAEGRMHGIFLIPFAADFNRRKISFNFN
jgi:hypothetical protein